MSFGLTLQPGPRVPKSCTDGISSLMQVSRAESLEGTSLLLIKTRDHKSLLGSCCQTTLHWSELSGTSSHLWVFVIQKQDVQRCSWRRIVSVPAVRQHKQWELCSRQARKALNFIPLYCPICVGFSPSLIVI